MTVVILLALAAATAVFGLQGLKVMLSVPSLRGVLHRYYPALWKSSRGLLRGQHSSMLTSLVKSELIKLIIALVVQVNPSIDQCVHDFRCCHS